MPGHFGFWLLKKDNESFERAIRRYRELMALIGVMPRPPVEEIPEEPPPPPVEEPPDEGDRIRVPEGAAPTALSSAIRRHFPREQWSNAARVSYYESTGWKRDAVLDTRHYANGRCNVSYTHPEFGRATTEWSIGYFQINACAHGGDFDYWTDTENNVRKAGELYRESGWHPWTLTARKLGLL